MANFPKVKLRELRLDGPGYIGKYDPGAKLAGGVAGIVQHDDGIEVSLPGGLSWGDVTDWPRATWLLPNSPDGRPMKASEIASICAALRATTHAGTSSDTTVYIVVHNTELLTDAAARGHGAGIQYTGATRKITGPRLLGGVKIDDGTTPASVPTVNRLVANFLRAGDGMLQPTIVGLTSDDVYAGASQGQGPLVGSNAFGTGRPYVSIVWGRTAATAGDVVVRHRPYAGGLSIPYLGA